MTADIKRRLPIGAELVPQGVHFRVWAPKCARVDVVVDGKEHALSGENGYFAGVAPGARAGSRYKFRLDGAEAFPDPASRYQPDGPHGDSQVVDPSTYKWTDGDWRGVDAKRQIVYEMHIGTFTPEGTFAAAAEQLPELAGLGVTCVEVMPVAEFPGRFGWGYDGVDIFAPYHGYGTPDDFRAFVNRAHEVGVGVLLDVVYNHFGPDGNYLRRFSDAYFTAHHHTDWGDAINYDGEDSGPVREMVLANVRHWIQEYHLDGLRLDATDNVYDDSEPHLLEELGLAARRAAGGLGILILVENEAQHAHIARPREREGLGLDMLWNDDFHHSARVAATGKREAYFADYRGTAQELLSAVKRGYLYQGQHYTFHQRRRGTPAWDVPRHRFVHYLQNHDQVANSGDGRRLHQLTSPGRYRALTALLLLAPQTPLLFQGQEFGSSAPFQYFADHTAELNAKVRAGRARFLAKFPSLATPDAQRVLPDPGARETFERSRIDFSERKRNAPHYALHRDLIALRQCDPVLCTCDAEVDGAVLSDECLVLRFFATGGDDRLLVVNLGAALSLDVAPEPLLAPPDLEQGWTRLWHSEDPCYGGADAEHVESKEGAWRITAEYATLLV